MNEKDKYILQNQSNNQSANINKGLYVNTASNNTFLGHKHVNPNQLSSQSLSQSQGGFFNEQILNSNSSNTPIKQSMKADETMSSQKTESANNIATLQHQKQIFNEHLNDKFQKSMKDSIEYVSKVSRYI